MSFLSHDDDTYLSVLGTDVILKATLGILVHDNSFLHPLASSRAGGLKELQ